MKLTVKHLLRALSLTIALVFTSCKEEIKHDGYTVTGTVKGLDNGWVKLIRPNYGDRTGSINVIDSVQIIDGNFQLKGKVDHVDMVSLQVGDTYYAMGGFILENSPITANIDLSAADKYGQFEIEVSGSEFNNLYNAQQKLDQAIFAREEFAPLTALREEMTKAYESKDESQIEAYEEKAKTFMPLQNKQQADYQQAKIDFVKKNPSSPIGPNVLGFQFSEGRMSKETMKEVFPLFEGEAKNTAMYAYYKKTYDEIFNSLGVGATAPDFTLTTLDKKELTLSTVQAKYKLIDFWASWCVPCRASFPHLKELYAKYKAEGFEIVAIGTADEEAKWEKAIEVDQTPWKHVYDTSSSDQKNSYGPVSVTYAVPFLPTTFLVDENDKIILRNPSKEELDNKLTALFGH